MNRLNKRRAKPRARKILERGVVINTTRPVNLGVLLPEQLNVVFRTVYFTNGSLAANVAGNRTYSLKANSIYDPSGDLANIKPDYYTNFAAMYYGYAVYKTVTKILVITDATAGSATANGTLQLTGVPTEGVAATSARAMGQMKGAKLAYTNCYLKPAEIQLVTDVHKFATMAPDFSTAMGADPGVLIYHNFNVNDPVGTATNFHFKVEMQQSTVLSGPLVQTADSTTAASVDGDDWEEEKSTEVKVSEVVKNKPPRSK